MEMSVLAFKSAAPFPLKLVINLEDGDNNTEDSEMHITLQKREKGKTWSSPIQGQGLLDPYAADQEQKRLMLQRFQEEVQPTFCTSCVHPFFHIFGHAFLLEPSIFSYLKCL